MYMKVLFLFVLVSLCLAERYIGQEEWDNSRLIPAKRAYHSNDGIGRPEIYIEKEESDNSRHPLFTKCIYDSGDGIGGLEIYIGKEESGYVCSRECMLRKRTDDSINGATYSTTGSKKCFCEKGMTGINNDKAWQSCMMTDISSIREYKCTYSLGDGTSEGELYLGKTKSENGCFKRCMKYKRYKDNSINGATYSTTGSGKCYCEKYMTGRNKSKMWKSCFFRVIYS